MCIIHVCIQDYRLHIRVECGGREVPGTVWRLQITCMSLMWRGRSPRDRRAAKDYIYGRNVEGAKSPGPYGGYRLHIRAECGGREVPGTVGRLQITYTTVM